MKLFFMMLWAAPGGLGTICGSLSQPGAGNGNFTAGAAYTISAVAPPAAAVGIPTLSEWSLAMMLALGSFVFLGRREG